MTKILSIENNILNRNLIRRYFTNTDVQLVEASSGTESLELAKIEQPDLILLTFHLLDMDSKDLVRKMRGMKNLKNVPIIGLIAHDSHILRQQMLDDGFDAVLYKPINRVNLMETINVHLFKVVVVC